MDKALRSAQIPKLGLRLRQEQKLRLRQRQKLRTIQKQKLRKKPRRKPPRKPPKRPPIIPLPKRQPVSFQTIARSKGGFNVIVRKRGRKVRINQFPLSGSQALAFGGNRVDNNLRRSFALVKTSGKPRSIKVGFFNAAKFRPPVASSKLDRFFIIEKVAFALDSRGEKRAIKAARRGRRIRGNPKRNNPKRNNPTRRVTVKKKKPNNLISFLFK